METLKRLKKSKFFIGAFVLPVAIGLTGCGGNNAEKVLLPKAVTLVTLVSDYTVELVPDVFGTLHGWGYHFPDGIGTGFDIAYFELTIENLSSQRFPINAGANFRLFVDGEDEGRHFAMSLSTTRDYRLATQIEPQSGTIGGENFPIGEVRGGVDFRVNSGDVITYLAYGIPNIENGEEVWDTLASWEINAQVPQFE